MTAEEIERAFQQAALSIQQLTQVAVRTDARLDASDSARREADERVEALIIAQVGYEARQERLEEAFRQVAVSHVQVVEMLRHHEERLDGHDEANVQTESRLDALIDTQIHLTERVDTLTRDIAALGHRFEEMAAVTNEQIKALIEAQARTDEQIEALTRAQTRTDGMVRSLLARDGKPAARAKKVTKKSKKGAK